MKCTHLKTVRAMRVFQHRRAYAAFADNGANARQRHIQMRRLRRLRRKEAKLQLAGVA